MNIVVLIPHGNIAPITRQASISMFKNGFYGAYSFPNLIPLFTTSLPMSKVNLKKLAANVRSLSSVEAKSDFFLSKELSTIALLYDNAKKLFLYGFEFPDLRFEKPSENIIYTFTKHILSIALLNTSDLEKISARRYEQNNISFRAASLANMTFSYVGCGDDDYSFRWEIGELVWLPKPRETING